MIRIIPSDERHFADHGWLQTYWHFSFSDYYDPKNMHFSSLRVFNDDVIQGGGGFPMHPHEDMEIVTYVIDGELEHQDRLGNRGIVHPGEVQVMSAGKGIVHSEHNASKTEPVHLIQLWILPRHKNNAPRWEQKRFSVEQRSGVLLPVVSSSTENGTLAIDQDAQIFVSRLKAGQKVVHESKPKRHVYLFVISGELEINGQSLDEGDQARIENETRLEMGTNEVAEFMLLDLP
jgi:quercetin 2,3-dioxygenase